MSITRARISITWSRVEVHAERHRGSYRGAWWVRAQTESTMRADLVGLGVRLRWVEANEKEDRALAVVMERLRYEGEGILLVYDNAAMGPIKMADARIAVPILDNFLFRASRHTFATDS
jgi:hypothetical protein